jgi:murein DD-endopeptidase MepM/ murein hydrolase activator NlpD
MKRISLSFGIKAALVGSVALTLAGCDPDGSFDADFRNFGRGGFDTSDAAKRASGTRPAADSRGIISYPNFDVAVARRGDTLESLAARTGIAASEIGSYNAISPGTVLREGEVVALPRRVGAGGGAPAIGTLPPGGGIDVSTIAAGAIDRAEAGGTGAAATNAAPGGAEPGRHRVVRGETAYTIARLYGVDVRALAEWNGLGPDLAVREGQYLLIPVAAASAPAPAVETATLPGEGSPTPLPPSASAPLPDEETVAAAKPVEKPASPEMKEEQTSASATKLAMPVQGKIIRGYQKKKNEGIEIAAAAGTEVRAAADGTVAAITKDTDQVPILVIRHTGNLLTVYANIEGITVAKGARVKRGETIARVRAGANPYLHFEVREGFDSVDPVPYLQ